MPLDFPNSPTNGQTYGNYYFDSSVGTGGAWRAQPIPVGGLPAGSIIQWGSATAPANWLICDGTAVSRSVYPSLFAAIGTTYGVGNGSTTFNLPDLRGRVAVGRNSGTFANLGGTGGAESVYLANNNLPPATILDAAVADTSFGLKFYLTNNYTAKSVSALGLTQVPVSTLQPYLVTNYIIKATAGWTAGDSELATRVGVLEAAPAGLVRVVPTSVAVGSGSASVSTTGRVSFTGTSSLTLNGCFTSTFENYRIVFRGIKSTTATNVLQARFVRNGTALNGASYDAGSHNFSLSDTSVILESGSGFATTLFPIGAWHYDTDALGVSLDVYRPATTDGQKTIAGTGHGSQAAIPRTLVISGRYRADSLAIDGWQFFNSAGHTMTGTVQVYGYRN